MPGCLDRSDLTVSKLTRIFFSRRLMRVPDVLRRGSRPRPQADMTGPGSYADHQRKWP